MTLIHYDHWPLRPHPRFDCGQTPLFAPHVSPLQSLLHFNCHVLRQPSRQSSRSNLCPNAFINLLDQTSSYRYRPHISCQELSMRHLLLPLSDNGNQNIEDNLSPNKHHFKQQQAQVKASSLVPNSSDLDHTGSFSPAKDQSQNHQLSHCRINLFSQKPKIPQIYCRLGWYCRLHTQLASPVFIYLHSRIGRGGCFLSYI